MQGAFVSIVSKMADGKVEFEIWENYLKGKIKDDKVLRVYLNYVFHLIEQGFPVIFEFEHLAKLFGVINSYLASLIISPQSHYRTFDIPKRRGGIRKVSAPTPTLLECQRWVNQYILNQIPLHDSAHGFVKEKSIITNASTHLSARAFLKMDLKEFFPNISSKKVFYVFRRIGYPPKISYFLSAICCLDDCLPQGAATSPNLSNIIAKRLDKRLQGLANCYSLKYSRYADDLAFSGDYISFSFLGRVKNIIHEEDFLVNDEKTLLIHGKGKRVLTGISICGEKLKLPKEKKRKIRQEVFYLLKNGYLNHSKKIEDYDPLYIEKLLGKLSFWRQIEPENKFVVNNIEKLKDYRSSTV